MTIQWFLAELKRYFQHFLLRISASMTIRGLVEHLCVATMPLWMHNHFSNYILTGFRRVTAQFSSFPDHLLQFLISKKIIPKSFQTNSTEKKWWIFQVSFKGRTPIGTRGYFIPTPTKPRFLPIAPYTYTISKDELFDSALIKEEISIPQHRYRTIRFGVSSSLVAMNIVRMTD